MKPWWLVWVTGCGLVRGPELDRLPFELDRHDPASNLAGDADFSAPGPGGRVLTEFLGSSADGDVTHVSVYLAERTPIVAASPGWVVERVEALPSDAQEDPEDLDVDVQATRRSDFVARYDGITDFAVKEGDFVEAGALLGWSVPDRAFTFRVSDDDATYCPNTFFAAEVAEELNGAIRTLMADWEEYVGDENVFHEDSMFAPGCARELQLEPVAFGR